MGGQVLLAVAGNVGSGKTTLTHRLVSRLGFVGLFESTEANPYLADFYGDMRRYALPAQLRFLAQRVIDTRRVIDEGASAIWDRTPWEDADIFAANLHSRGAMDDRDFETYRMLASQLLADVRPPDLLVYLQRSVASCRDNIARRGRDYEDSIPISYLEDLSLRYDAFFESWDRSRKLLVRAEDYDFLRDGSHLSELVGRIAESLPQRFLSFG
ncbi:Deoxyadenosine kinase [Sandaracinus amylolyticus]|uniref:Deoxyadenosine kinase n=1 Tax=Sandaracinus amylolyticus TaxID=927083 RepID=A0A0F6YI52_9BACT|nr:Deoxyadenosine kinase [Sandaracinus amylolyticus]